MSTFYQQDISNYTEQPLEQRENKRNFSSLYTPIRKLQVKQNNKKQKLEEQPLEQRENKRKISSLVGPLYSPIRKSQVNPNNKKQKLPNHYNIVICCHGDLIETDETVDRKKKRSYNIHQQLTDINFMVNYGEILSYRHRPQAQNVNTLSECEVKGNCDYSSEASIVMRLVCDSKASNIIKKKPINTGEITLSEMSFSFNTHSVESHSMLWFKQLFGFWICAPGLYPIKVLDYNYFNNGLSYNWQDMFNSIGNAFHEASSIGMIPPDDEFTYSLFMFCCRANKNALQVVLKFSRNPSIRTDMRGGEDINIKNVKNQIKSQELDDLNKKSFVQLTEDQFDFFLSPENPTINEVIDSLDNMEVQELIEEEEKIGGKKRRGNNKQKTKRKLTRKFIHKKRKSIRNKKYKYTRVKI